MPGGGEGSPHLRSRAEGAADLEGAADVLHPLAHGDQPEGAGAPEARLGGPDVEALTVIGDDHIFTPFDSGMLGMIAETPASVTLLNPVVVGANFQFQFLSQAGFTHDILFQTNPAAAVWLTNSTVAGDGTVRTISIPLSVFSPSMDGFVRVSTH